VSAQSDYDRDGFVLRRGLLPHAITARLVAIGERVYAQWLRENGDEGRRRDLVNSSALTARPHFPPPFETQRVEWFDAIADDALVLMIDEGFGRDLYFHGTMPAGTSAPGTD
jgi:hypothetical protein